MGERRSRNYLDGDISAKGAGRERFYRIRFEYTEVPARKKKKTDDRSLLRILGPQRGTKWGWNDELQEVQTTYSCRKGKD